MASLKIYSSEVISLCWTILPSLVKGFHFAASYFPLAGLA